MHETAALGFLRVIRSSHVPYTARRQSLGWARAGAGATSAASTLCMWSSVNRLPGPVVVCMMAEARREGHLSAWKERVAVRTNHMGRQNRADQNIRRLSLSTYCQSRTNQPVVLLLQRISRDCNMCRIGASKGLGACSLAYYIPTKCNIHRPVLISDRYIQMVLVVSRTSAAKRENNTHDMTRGAPYARLMGALPTTHPLLHSLSGRFLLNEGHARG